MRPCQSDLWVRDSHGADPLESHHTYKTIRGSGPASTGFVKGRSCLTGLISCDKQDDLIGGWGKGWECIYQDLGKAFHTISHSILINITIISCFSFYLTFSVFFYTGMNLLHYFSSFFQPILYFSQIMFYLCTSFFCCCFPFSLIALPACLALHWHLKENTLSQELRSRCLETKPNCRGQNAAAPKLPRRDSSLDFTTAWNVNLILFSFSLKGIWSVWNSPSYTLLWLWM